MYHHLATNTLRYLHAIAFRFSVCLSLLLRWHIWIRSCLYCLHDLLRAGLSRSGLWTIILSCASHFSANLLNRLKEQSFFFLIQMYSVCCVCWIWCRMLFGIRAQLFAVLFALHNASMFALCLLLFSPHVLLSTHCLISTSIFFLVQRNLQ